MNNEENEDQMNEKLIADLISKRNTKNVNKTTSLSFGARLSDRIAEVAGSWPFILCFLAAIIIWITLNVTNMAFHFDRYPFILLNLVLSCVAALQAPIIMMSQNRHEKKETLKSQKDLDTDLKSEVMIEEILKTTKRIEQIENKQDEILELLKNK